MLAFVDSLVTLFNVPTPGGIAIIAVSVPIAVLASVNGTSLIFQSNETLADFGAARVIGREMTLAGLRELRAVLLAQD